MAVNFSLRNILHENYFMKFFSRKIFKENLPKNALRFFMKICLWNFFNIFFSKVKKVKIFCLLKKGCWSMLRPTVLIFFIGILFEIFSMKMFYENFFHEFFLKESFSKTFFFHMFWLKNFIRIKKKISNQDFSPHTQTYKHQVFRLVKKGCWSMLTLTALINV